MTVAKWASLATCTFLYQLTHLLMCTHDLPCCHRPLQLALYVAEVYPLPTRHLLMCTHTHEHVLHICTVWWWWRWYICSLIPRLYCGNGLGTRLFCNLVSPSYPIIYQASTIALASSFYIGSQANGGLEPNTIIPLISNTQLLIN